MVLSAEQHPELDIARYRSFARTMPPIYLCTAAALWSVASVYGGKAPALATTIIPLFISILAIWRAFVWARLAEEKVKPDVARKRLTIGVTILLATCVVVAADEMVLFHIGTEAERNFLLPLVGIYTIVISVFLVNLRVISFLSSAILLLPTSYLYIAQGHTPSILLGVLLLLIAFGMAFSLKSYYQDFEELTRSKINLLRLSEENARLASLDMLTELPNRRHYFSTLSEKLEAASENGSRIAAGIVDLDGFKAVNDTYGHRVGDRVLAIVSQRLSKVAPEVENFCRIGGDEFAFHVSGKVDAETLTAIGDKLIGASEQHIMVGDIVVSISCSIGFAVYPDMATSADELFERADFALYQAKRTGRSHPEIFSPRHQAEIAAQSAIEQALRMADQEAELFPVFQPIIDCRTGATIAFECLARWNSPVLGEVSPGQFIPVAERAGLISSLTVVMLKKALSAMASWPEDVGLSFNLSSYDIANPLNTMRLIGLVEASGIPPSRIWFELTETALLHDFPTAQRNIAALKASGLHVALDDFGTGYSSLSHVQMLPLDKLKIDRRFVTDIETNPTSQMIVRSLVLLCQGIGIGCVVEGAETEGQLNALRKLGCQVVQGYYYSRPLASDAVDGFLRRVRHAA